jgi:hypothetical protein
VVGHAEIGATRWSLGMRVTGSELCTSWLREGEATAAGEPAEGCASEWDDFLRPDRAAPVFVELIGGTSNGDATFVSGIAGFGLARVELDYGAGVIAPPLVDLAPISLRGFGFAFAHPGDIDIGHISGFNGEGLEVLSQTR